MAANTGKLVGRTVFITGASRGIGKAIALKLARHGANIVVAAKTAEPHPTLPGTIYTAAKEMEEAGGKALPCVVDIRSEEQVQNAVKQAVNKFGGIDILVNNASAISLTGTLQTPMKRYDLMNGINARGTYLCSQACLPYLLKGKNPHILNISPPLNMAAKWFQGHVAYTMAKYGMSMCALGMAEEFREEGIAVNTLWPRTAIYTAAMEMLGGGSEVAKQCRKVDIMSDAAYILLSQDSRSFTGNFCIDDEILLQNGVKDLSVYDCVPGSKLLPDFFLDVGPEELAQQMSAHGATPAFYKSAPGSEPAASEATASSSSSSLSGPAYTFQLLRGMLSEELVKRVKGVFQFNLTGADEGTWYLDLKNGTGDVGNGEPADRADCTMTMDSALFTDMFAGKASPTTSFMMGKLKIKGDMALAMKLEKLMQQTQKSKL
ncbi:hydroxysteroid dehydrogenase-like protein 2 [Babylonia areolata]|uniref:hydroxysteroid dehydrogenase-like protein 2 n=1 Tax=Babylonia areolata TaxID=304850 RepID=UPI003FD4C29A